MCMLKLITLEMFDPLMCIPILSHTDSNNTVRTRAQEIMASDMVKEALNRGYQREQLHNVIVQRLNRYGEYMF